MTRDIPGDGAVVECDIFPHNIYGLLLRLSVDNGETVIDVSTVIKDIRVMENVTALFEEVSVQITEIRRVRHAHGKAIELKVDLVLELRNQINIADFQASSEEVELDSISVVGGVYVVFPGITLVHVVHDVNTFTNGNIGVECHYIARHDIPFTGSVNVQFTQF
jgi:hypothetical protein